LPSLRFFIYGQGTEFTIDRKKIEKISYAAEAVRGYEAAGDLWTPGYFVVNLAMGGAVTLVASTEPWDIVQALRPADALNSERERRTRLLAAAQANAANGFAAELVLAADQFIITPAGRLQDATRAYAAGDEMRTAIAGYHWFTDWGRDTMISLEGLTLATRRYAEAGWILRGFAETIRDGLIPNLFPEGMQKGVYHTADATLWFFHAIDVYLRATEDRITLRLCCPSPRHHRAPFAGTRFGIGVDSEDGLLRQASQICAYLDGRQGRDCGNARCAKPSKLMLWYSAHACSNNGCRRSRCRARRSGYSRSERGDRSTHASGTARRISLRCR
jgi:predicted glycogen debranching enzyme